MATATGGPTSARPRREASERRAAKSAVSTKASTSTTVPAAAAEAGSREAAWTKRTPIHASASVANRARASIAALRVRGGTTRRIETTRAEASAEATAATTAAN